MAEALGTIVQSIGAVIDIEFPREAMPGIYDALVLEDSAAGGLVEKGLTFEVEQQLGDGIVRCIALGSSDGLRRGMNGVGSNARVSRDDSKPRLPTSDQLHLVERIRLVADGEILEDEMTITDPKAYTEPLVIKHYWQRRPDIEVLEYVCNERPRDSGDVIQTKEGGP